MTHELSFLFDAILTHHRRARNEIKKETAPEGAVFRWSFFGQ
jgi:hypothetical protein